MDTLDTSAGKLTPSDGASGPADAIADATAGVRRHRALSGACGWGLVRSAIVILGDRAAAEDVVQVAFLGLYRHWTGLVDPDSAAYLGWANADGSVIIGSEVCAGHARFGIFSGDGFTPLPALPTSLPVRVGVLDGTFAW